MSKHGWTLAALVAVVSLAVVGTAVAGPPETESEAGTFCGIEGTWTFRTNVDRFMLVGDGFVAHFSGYGRFTSDATGEWIEFASTGTDKFVGLVDNGDGTYSVVLEHSGSGIRLLTSSGLVAPNWGAGKSIVEDVFRMPAGGIAAANPEVDEYLFTRSDRVGGRPAPPGGGDLCTDVVIPALT